MVEEGIILGHQVSIKGIEVDRAKLETIENLLRPSSVKKISGVFLAMPIFMKDSLKTSPKYPSCFVIF